MLLNFTSVINIYSLGGSVILIRYGGLPMSPEFCELQNEKKHGFVDVLARLALAELWLLRVMQYDRPKQAN